MDVKDLFDSIKKYENKAVVLEGWVRNNRNQSNFGFIDFNDGTYFKNLQLVYDKDLKDFDSISKIRVGSAIRVKGKIVKSEGGGQSHELKVESVELLGDSPEDYPIQPKRHTREFLREVAYLRPRTNLFNAVFRVRSACAQAIHEYFQSNNYVYFHSPIITGADCEGSDQMFKVTTFDFDNLPKDEKGKVDYKEDLFGKKAKKGEKEQTGNREIKDLVAALGCGIQEAYNEFNLRFGKVVILADSDVDGSHIQCLVLSFFVNYMPDLIKNGHLYIIDAPLFIASSAKNKVYGMTRAEVDAKMRKLSCKDYTVLRMKGWGETNPEQLNELCLNPETRHLMQLQWTDDLPEVINKIMGAESNFRKELLGIN